MGGLHRFVRGLNGGLAFVGGAFLAAMVLLTCGNILLRIVWVPIPGTFELMGFFGAVTAAFALGYTQLRRGHIAVDVLIGRFSRGTRRALDAVNSLVCMIFFAVVAWQIGLKATVLMRSGEVTETLRVAYHPFTYGVAVGCGALALVFFADLVRAIRPGEGSAR
jgi:TRAP-type C4-dicarboxylate transport system permease small subunit